MWGQSNYPPSGGNPFAAGAYGASSGWAPSSGPPPPPGAGGYSAYNVNQYPTYPGYPGGYGAYGGGGGGGGGGGYGGYPGGGYGGYGMGSHPPPQPGQGGSQYYAGGGYGYQQGAAVPGFTAPAVPQQYPGGQGPPPMQPPPAHQYQYMQNMMANQSLYHMQHDLMKKMGLLETDQEEEQDIAEAKRRLRNRRRNLDAEDEEIDMEEEKRKMEERLKRSEERAQKLQERLEADDGLKSELRERFIDELMRRQEVTGTFEPTSGTIIPFDSYDEEDPAAQWFTNIKNDSIVGEKWDPLYDAEYMRNGIRGWGTDEAAIIAMVSTRCNSQRNAILREYKTAYGRDLIEDLHSDLSGKFRECVLALFETPARYDAYSIKKAIYGIGTNELALIEILMTRTNAQIQEMVQEYNNITYSKRKKPECSLEDDIKDDTSGDFKRLLIANAQGNRRLIEREKLEEAVVETMVEGKWTGMFHVDYSKCVNMERCKKRAEELFNAGQERWGTDEETFVRIFSTQDYYSMRAIWDEYVKISQNDVMGAVKSETSGDFKHGLLALAQNMRCRPMYFAERLYKSMKGLGTDDSTLIRIVVSRSEIDLVQIKQCFLEKYHQTLWKFIMDDTSGDYRKLLCGIVGKN